MRSVFAFVRDGYDRRSAWALGALAVTYATVGVVFSQLIDTSADMDWLLAGIWLFMTATLCWKVDIQRDVKLAAVAFVGGLVIEWWGTTTNIWRYYTHERPPLWILPAWPVAALTIERLAIFTARILPARLPTLLAWLTLPVFVVFMTRFSWRSIDIFSTKVIIGLMIGVLVTSTDRRRDVAILLAGTALGVFLEYWGTSRWCWRYYTHEVPPPVATAAHGFASVAFARGVWAAQGLWRRFAPRPAEAPLRG